MTSDDNVYQDLVRSLTKRDDLSPKDLELVQSLRCRLAHYNRGFEFIVQETVVTDSCFVLKGWAGRSLSLRNGKRQITALHVAGDFVDLHSFTLKFMDHSVVALTDLDVVYVSHNEILRVTEASPHLARLFWTLTTIDGAIHRMMIASLGRRPALERLGHLICELDCRLAIVGLMSNDHCFDMPIIQEDLADIMGLSVVHMNRTIQDLRQTDLIKWVGNKITIPNFEKMAAFAGFSDHYLNYTKRQR